MRKVPRKSYLVFTSLLAIVLFFASSTVLVGCQNNSGAHRETTNPKQASEPPATPEGDPVLVGAGDIASCDDLAGAQATTKLLDRIPGTVFAAGDLAYSRGTDEQFAHCYGPTWGRHKVRTRPTPGNHEYLTDKAAPYFRFFGAAAGDPKKGYYSYDLGTWHIAVLNSDCDEVGGCDAQSPQAQWLATDLAHNSTACSLAYWHVPLFSSGGHGDASFLKPIWQILYGAGVDLVINGHDHDYERFAPQDPDGKADPQRGIREFVVGTGGNSSHRTFASVQPNSQVRNDDTFGVLKLTLHQASYDWQFVPEAGKDFADAGRGICH